MMEDLICQCIKEDAAILASLATYAGAPAVFSGAVPPENDPDWGAVHYPRIQFTLDWYYQEDNADGVLTMNVESLQTDIAPNRIVLDLKRIFRGLLLTDGTPAVTAGFQAKDSDDYDGSDNGQLISGITLTFDAVRYSSPPQTQLAPLSALNTFTKEVLPEAKVFGVDPYPAKWTPSDSAPGFCWQCKTVTSDSNQIRALNWVDAEFTAHLLSPEPSQCQARVQKLAEAMAEQDAVLLSDGGPLLFQNIRYTFAADPLRDGQITLEARYSKTRAKETGEILQHPNLEYLQDS